MLRVSFTHNSAQPVERRHPAERLVPQPKINRTTNLYLAVPGQSMDTLVVINSTQEWVMFGYNSRLSTPSGESNEWSRWKCKLLPFRGILKNHANPESKPRFTRAKVAFYSVLSEDVSSKTNTLKSTEKRITVSAEKLEAQMAEEAAEALKREAEKAKQGSLVICPTALLSSLTSSSADGKNQPQPRRSSSSASVGKAPSATSSNGPISLELELEFAAVKAAASAASRGGVWKNTPITFCLPSLLHSSGPESRTEPPSYH